MTGLERELLDTAMEIYKDGENLIPYCNMKKKNCFESYNYTCPNFEYYKKISGETNENQEVEIQEVDQLGKHLIECPACGNKFTKKDLKSKKRPKKT